jgi:hypothetical protein
MKRHELQELHYITPICNIPSILQNGILSFAQAARLQHNSVAMRQIQDKRDKKQVPQGRLLHEYANLYICGRNPMLYKRRDQYLTICVLHIDPAVIDLPNVVITDQNAASDYACFAGAPDGLKVVDTAKTFADDWRHPNQIEYWQRKAAKCAEILVPDRVDPRFIRKAYVSCDQARQVVDSLNTDLKVVVNRHLFFM